MKPLVLKMKAFGSYAKETTVNFNDLDSGLYLITGDTGAGKTTIFDAMVFALFGEASGTGRSPAMLHSDFVSKSEDTVVSFTFEHLNREYTVERKLHCPKKRDGSFDDPKQIAVLYEEGKLPIEIPSKVTNRIIEIIGLDANQFRQIIVLAQGEFQKFLKADGKERNEILGKLFDNSPYVKFQSRLKKASDQLERLMEEDRKAIKILMDSFKAPKDDDKMLYIPENPNLIDNIEALVNKEKIENNELKVLIDKILADKSKLEAQKTTAETNNKSLDIYEQLKKIAKELADKQEYYQQLNEQLISVEKASKVVSYENKCIEAKKRLDNNTIILNNKSEEMKAVKLQLDSANAEYEKVKTLNDEKTSLNSDKDRLSLVLENFKPYNEAVKLLNEKNNSLNSLNLESSILIKKKEELQNSLTANKSQQESISEIAQTSGAKEIEAQQANNKYLQITGRNGLCDKVNEISLLCNKLNVNKQKELALVESVTKAKNDYDSLYDRFIKSQANILANSLKVKLENDEETYCPVCHSHLVKSDIERLAFSNETVNKADVDRARAKFDDAEKSRNELHTMTSNVEVEIEAKKNSAVDFAKQLNIDINTYDELSADYLATLKANSFNELNLKQDLANKAKEAKNTLESLVAKMKNIEASISINDEKINSINQKISSTKEEISSLQANVDNLLKALKGLSEQETKDKLLAVNNRIREIDITVERITEHKNKLDSSFNSLNGTVEMLLKNNAQYQAEHEASLVAYNDKLMESGFTNEASYKEVLSIAGSDIDRWINNTRNQINNYQTDVKSNSDQLVKQQELCKDLEYSDTTEINNKLFAVNEEFKQKNTEKENINAILKGHEDILKEVKRRQSSIAKYIPAGIRLRKLADLANGYSTDGGKLSFDRYVMGDAFGEILDAANVHLAIMTGGQYELIHQVKAATKAAVAGLDIDIFDSFTGEQRKPDSLSGGEKFQVSMSLALGLSDVVQDRAGGKKIESMYIDEGFGSLDEAILDKAIEVLKNIAGDSRQIGIISHVARLEESIQQKIIVKKTDQGSVLTIQK